MTDMDQERIYQNALLLIEGRLYAEAADELARIPGYKDADKQRLFCEEKKATAHLDRIYDEAHKAAGNMNVRSQEKAIQIFQKIPGYRDADAQPDAHFARLRIGWAWECEGNALLGPAAYGGERRGHFGMDAHGLGNAHAIRHDPYIKRRGTIVAIRVEF